MTIAEHHVYEHEFGHRAMGQPAADEGMTIMRSQGLLDMTG